MDTLLIDGNCGLCNRGAMFLQPRISPKKSLRIILIESEEGKKLISTLPEKLVASSLEEAVTNADIVITCTGRDEDMNGIIHGV